MKQQPKEEPRRSVILRSANGRRKANLEFWKYWEIVCALREMGLERKEAYDAAEWARMMKPGQKQLLPLGITMEVTEA